METFSLGVLNMPSGTEMGTVPWRDLLDVLAADIVYQHRPCRCVGDVNPAAGQAFELGGIFSATAVLIISHTAPGKSTGPIDRAKGTAIKCLPTLPPPEPVAKP